VICLSFPFPRLWRRLTLRSLCIVVSQVFDIVNQGLPEYQQYPTSTDSTSK
jgi:hypothetical protein